MLNVLCTIAYDLDELYQAGACRYITLGATQLNILFVSSFPRTLLSHGLGKSFLYLDFQPSQLSQVYANVIFFCTIIGHPK